MDPWLIVAANALGCGVLFAGIALCVYFDQRGKTRRRELEHLERMRVIELGRPLEDAAVTRNKALGAIGVAVPIVSISGAVVGSCIALAIEMPWRIAAFVVNWIVCGAVCVAVLPLLVRHMRVPPPSAEPPDPDDG